jgi:AcrR family transcriptional regulator
LTPWPLRGQCGLQPTRSRNPEPMMPVRRKPRFDPDGTRRAILEAAHDEFTQHGLTGARVDAIAARTNTVKRMIYYYFGSKEGLYLAVLEQAYREIRQAEAALNLAQLAPTEAIRRLVEFTFDYHESHPGFIRLVCTENIHNGEHVARSTTIKSVNRSAIEVLASVLDRGKRQGVFRADVDPVDVHMMISACCFFRVANRYTFGMLFDRDLSNPVRRRRHKKLIVDMVLHMLERPVRQTEGRRTAAA